MVSETTVATYVVRAPKKPSETRRTSLQRHMDVTAAFDVFTVPTLTFKALYVFIVIAHDRRQILHVNVPQHPTAERTAQQAVEALPGDEDVPRFLIHDRDAIYLGAFRVEMKTLGIERSESSETVLGRIHIANA